MDPSEDFKPSPPAPSTVQSAAARPQPSRSTSSSLLLSRSSPSGLPPPPPPPPSSTTPTFHRYQPSPSAFDQRPTYSKPEIRPPFGSNRSSSSTGGGARVVVGQDGAEEVDLPFDYFFEGDGGGDSGSSTNGSVGGWFADIQLEGVGHPHPPPPPHFASPSQHHLSPPSPSYHPASHLPLPSPLTYQYAPNFDAHHHHHHESSGWHSLNPFAVEALKREEDGNDGSSTSIVGFTLIKSAEETRTPQACQACRSRKSKCDGNAPCIRCENRGIACVYVQRSPRTRGSSSKRGAAALREPTASSLTSCFTTAPLVHPPISSPAVGYSNSERGVGTSRRRSSDGEWGVVAGPRAALARRDNESRSSPVGGEGSRRGSRSIPSGLLTVEGGGGAGDDSRRRRPSTDPYPSPHIPIPIESSHQPPPPSFRHSQSYPTPIAYSSFHSYETQTYRPPPPPLHQMQRHSVSQLQPHLSHQHYPPPLSEHQTHSLSNRYSPFASSTPLHQYGSTPPLDHHSLLRDQQPSDASPSFNVGLPAQHPPTFHHHPPEPYQPQRIQHPSESRRSSFPSVQAPSTGSHLGFFPRLVEETEGSPPAPAAREVGGAVSSGSGENWAEGKWEELSYQG